MKRWQKLSLSISVLGTLAISIVVLSNPLRRSDDAVQSWLLSRVPVGSEIDLLMSAAQENDWRVNGVWEGNRPESHTDWGGIDGATVVWIYLGGYRNVFRTDLDSFWAFDEAGQLVAVKTRRMTDAL
ncbi:hypothetical protein sS8_0019 [Methylocaldum marinum]|uniref:Uncharacterized protein n=1 Tax=Methylocaldum marinum TaxID=1432792 RepID=A0A286T747_9GAMM|nr:hypothetical protein sS8_0019 [Methylocaldum marinum]